MATTVLSITKGVRETWNRLGKRQRLIIVSGVCLAFLASIMTVVLAKRGPNYEVLWSNLEPQDAGLIVKELERQSIPFELESSGTTIKVPATEVHKVRLTLASQGLPSSGIVGFESIDTSGIWATDFDRRVQYVRALSGELTRTVRAIVGVQDARVHIVLPESSVFATKSKPATAAVMIETMPMHEISPSTVKGIINLVACSVEGLSPDDIAVIDQKGRLLSDNYESRIGDIEVLSNTAFQLTSNVERELEHRLIGLLSPVLGAGNVVCQVRADLDLDQVRITDTSYPVDAQGVVRSEETRTETYSGTGALPGGQAGGLDVPTYSNAAGTGDSEYQLSERVTNYEINQTVTETLVTPGQIERLSVAVVVNKELDDAERLSIEETVSAALGLDPSRKDTISISGMPFDTSLAERVGQALTPAPNEEIPKAYIYGAAVAAALLLGTLIIFGRRRKHLTDQVMQPSLVQETEEEQDGLDGYEELSTSAQHSVERVARTNPAMVASLLKSWIVEDEK
jgi:flagellar M-ring protein FliF